jgi:hypothetical protein
MCHPQIINAGNKVTFEDLEWSGQVYQLKGPGILGCCWTDIFFSQDRNSLF